MATAKPELFVDDRFISEHVTIYVPMELLTETQVVSDNGWSPELTKLKQELQKFKPELSVHKGDDEGSNLKIHLWNCSAQQHGSIPDEDVKWAIHVILKTFWRELDDVTVSCERRVNLRLPYDLRDNPGEALGEGATATVLGRAY